MDTGGWDAIVIGSGLGGLSAAVILGRAGKRVLVLERLANPGGAATVYRHGTMTIEASLHEVDGDTLHASGGSLAQLGLAGQLEPIATDEFYEVRGAMLAAPIRVPHGLDAARAALIAALPDARVALDGYFDALARLHATLSAFETGRVRGPADAVRLALSGGLFSLIGMARRSVAQAFDRAFGTHEAAKIALGAPVSYFDDDPAVLSFLLFAGVWSRYVGGGSFYLRGGSRALTMALAGQVKAGGGDLRRRCEATEILLDRLGTAAGVRWRTADGGTDEARAPLVLAGAAPAHVAAMLPGPSRAAFLHRYDRYQPSISLFNVAVGLSRPAADFGVTAYSTFVMPKDMAAFADYPRHAAVFAGDPGGGVPPFVLADYGRLAGLARDGDAHAISLCGVDRLRWWDGLDEAAEHTRRQRWADALIADADRQFPGLGAAVTQAEIATARTMHSRLGTPQGEVYGFRPSPARLFSRPPRARTTIPGLYLGSAYTIAGGYAGAIQGGLIAARTALHDAR